MHIRLSLAAPFICMAALATATGHARVIDASSAAVAPPCAKLLPYATPKAPGLWTLSALTRFALCNNPTQRAAAAMSADDSMVDAAEAAFLPSIGFSVGLSKSTSTGNTLIFDADNPTAMTEAVTSASSKSQVATLQASYTLWDFGVRSANLKKAKHQRSASLDSARFAQQLFTTQISQAYFNVLNALAGPQEGPGASMTRLAQAQLAGALGLPLDATIELDSVGAYDFESPGDWGVWWALAKDRPDLLAARARVLDEQETSRASKAADLGSVSLSFSYSPGHSSVGGKSVSQTTSLMYSVPLFNGPRTDKAAATQLASRQFDEEAAQQTAQLEVYRTWEAYNQAYLALKAEKTDTEVTSPNQKALLLAAVQARIALLQAVGRLTPESLGATAAQR